MTTENPTQTRAGVLRAALALLAAAASAAAGAAAASAHPTTSAQVSVGTVHLVSTTLSTARWTWTYTWPLKPFGRQHPVRAFLDDPRIGGHGGQAFHFGIDISAPDGTAVYAVEGGTVYLSSTRAVAVLAPGGSHVFGYWHIVPAVKSHEFVHRHQLLGYIDKGWEHVHFAEKRDGVYVNPLRNGGLGPYGDHTAPTVASVVLQGSDLVAVAYDTPDPVVPGAWAHEPVTPALLRWRTAGGQWKIAADFRTAMLDRSLFTKIYTPATRQNHEGKPGVFSFYLRRRWVDSALSAGTTTIEVEAMDTAGNCTVAAAVVTFAV